MTKQELIQKLSSLEWEDFEVKTAKSELPKSVWKTVSAFANTTGGWLVLGVKEEGKNFEISGVGNAEKLEQDFLNTLRGTKFNVFIESKQEVYHFDDKTVLAFYIPVHKNKPVYFNNQGNTFIRRGSADQRATRDEIDSMLRDRIFTNHIEFYNPGGLPKPFEELKNKDISLPRNPIMAKLFRMVKLAENAGFGFDKIESNWKLYNNTFPHYQIEFDSVIVNFSLEDQDKLGDKLGDKLNDNQVKILNEIKHDRTISITELSAKIGISNTAVENNIAKLKKAGYIQREGSAKSGYWLLKQKPLSNNK